MQDQRGSSGTSSVVLLVAVIMFVLYIGTLPIRDDYWGAVFQWLLSQ